MKWKKIDDYAIGANNFTIAKYIIAGNAKYILWELPNKMIKIFNTAQEAKNEAMAIDKTKPSVPDRLSKDAGFVGGIRGGYKKEKKGTIK